jgi:hypothetical protein
MLFVSLTQANSSAPPQAIAAWVIAGAILSGVIDKAPAFRQTGGRMRRALQWFAVAACLFVPMARAQAPSEMAFFEPMINPKQTGP